MRLLNLSGIEYAYLMNKLLLIPLFIFSFPLNVPAQVIYSTFSDPTGKFSTTQSGICFSCSISNTSNVADADFSNNATIIVSAGIAASRGIRAKLPSLVPGNTKAGFYFSVGSVVAGLPSITLTTYKSGSARETLIAGGNIISLLGGSLGYICSTTSPSLDYDEVGISFNGGLFTVGLSADVFYAFGGGATCPVFALPLTSIRLSVKSINSIPLVTWEMATDKNATCNLQRSYDAVTFNTIHTVNNLKPGYLNTFTYRDSSTAENSFYYRIEVVDNSTSASYFSETVHIRNERTEIKNGISIFPNPVTANYFTLALPPNYQPANKVVIIDETGRIIDEPSVLIARQSIRVSLRKKLAPGIYTVRIISSSNNQPVCGRLVIAPK
jgi:hypothetical protein